MKAPGAGWYAQSCWRQGLLLPSMAAHWAAQSWVEKGFQEQENQIQGQLLSSSHDPSFCYRVGHAPPLNLLIGGLWVQVPGRPPILSLGIFFQAPSLV